MPENFEFAIFAQVQQTAPGRKELPWFWLVPFEPARCLLNMTQLHDSQQVYDVAYRGMSHSSRLGFEKIEHGLINCLLRNALVVGAGPTMPAPTPIPNRRSLSHELFGEILI
jgi:hypothetical protein